MRLVVTDSIDEVEPEAWNRLCGNDNPFIEHGFLRGLEVSGSVGSHRTGWVPRHVLAYADDNSLVGALPLYEKFDSYGEYIFDWGWARAAESARIRYYPKLVTAVPFTPATGPRILLAPDAGPQVGEALIAAVQAVAKELDVSSAHMLFVSESEQQLLMEHEFMPRASYQFHWRNQNGWSCFDDYLAAMKSRVRKQIRKERREAASHGLTLSVKRGSELTQQDWDALWEFYQITASRKWGRPYLTRAFYKYLQQEFAHRVVASFAHLGDEPMAGTLMFQKGEHLYGRYWGAKTPLHSMHFELCYYLPIQWALENGITLFEAGAQGEHKLKRGFLPSPCYSAHWIRHPGLADAIAEFLPREAGEVDYTLDVLGDHAPFRHTPPDECE